MASLLSDIQALGFSASGTALAVVAGVTFGSIVDQLMAQVIGKLLDKLPMSSVTAGSMTLSGRFHAFLVVAASVALAYGAFSLMAMVPGISLSGVEMSLALTVYVATQSVALSAAKAVVSTQEEKSIAGWFSQFV